MDPVRSVTAGSFRSQWRACAAFGPLSNCTTSAHRIINRILHAYRSFLSTDDSESERMDVVSTQNRGTMGQPHTGAGYPRLCILLMGNRHRNNIQLPRVASAAVGSGMLEVIGHLSVRVAPVDTTTLRTTGALIKHLECSKPFVCERRMCI